MGDTKLFAPAPLPSNTLVRYCAEFSDVPAGVWQVVELCACPRCQSPGALRDAQRDQTTIQPHYILELPWSRARLRDVGHDSLTPLADQPDPELLVQDELNAYW